MKITTKQMNRMNRITNCLDDLAKISAHRPVVNNHGKVISISPSAYVIIDIYFPTKYLRHFFINYWNSETGQRLYLELLQGQRK